jgi:RNA 2',3'-cyclic 3'-phosphodiesterase
MRLFVAIAIERDIREAIAAFLDGVRDFAPDARWVRSESLHITLKFIGEKSEQEAEHIKSALGTIQAGAFDMSIRGHGFFPTSRAPRVFWIGVDAGPELGALAAVIDHALAEIGTPKEENTFNPHLTLARAGDSRRVGKRGNDNRSARFHLLQDKLIVPSAPEFGTMAAREFFLYQSQPSPGGSKYTKLVRFALQERSNKPQ